MKIQIRSDLHLEMLERSWPNYRQIDLVGGADVLVIAGDIHCGTRALGAFADSIGRSNTRFLEQNEYVLNNVRVVGTTLWTDYSLGGN